MSTQKLSSCICKEYRVSNCPVHGWESSFRVAVGDEGAAPMTKDVAGMDERAAGRIEGLRAAAHWILGSGYDYEHIEKWKAFARGMANSLFLIPTMHPDLFTRDWETTREAVRPAADMPREGECAAPIAKSEVVYVVQREGQICSIHETEESAIEDKKELEAKNAEVGYEYEVVPWIVEDVPAAPDSREELKRKIDAITCEGCRLGMTRYKYGDGGGRHAVPKSLHPTETANAEWEICTAKGAEILALLPALKSEGDAAKKGSE
jgi:hypothetical protein